MAGPGDGGPGLAGDQLAAGRRGGGRDAHAAGREPPGGRLPGQDHGAEVRAGGPAHRRRQVGDRLRPPGPAEAGGAGAVVRGHPAVPPGPLRHGRRPERGRGPRGDPHHPGAGAGAPAGGDRPGSPPGGGRGVPQGHRRPRPGGEGAGRGRAGRRGARGRDRRRDHGLRRGPLRPRLPRPDRPVHRGDPGLPRGVRQRGRRRGAVPGPGRRPARRRLRRRQGAAGAGGDGRGEGGAAHGRGTGPPAAGGPSLPPGRRPGCVLPTAVGRLRLRGGLGHPHRGATRAAGRGGRPGPGVRSEPAVPGATAGLDPGPPHRRRPVRRPDRLPGEPGDGPDVQLPDGGGVGAGHGVHLPGRG